MNLVEASGFYFVLIKDGLARVINEDDPELFKAWDDGWETEWDSARTVEAGLEFAEREFGALPWDKYKPVRMIEPMTLYRSVSIPELADIAQKGKIIGKGNTFNEYDHRRWVFFGDTIDANLIFQGADIERQAQIALQNHPIHAKFKRLMASMKAKRQQIVDSLQNDIEEINDHLLARHRNPELVELTDEMAAAFVNDAPGAGEVARLIPYDPKNPTRKLYKQYMGLRDKIEPLRQEYRKIFGEQFRQMKAAQEGMSITSAILETKPITGGLEYSLRAGSQVGHSMAEYGFKPGQITLDDIVKVHYVKGREIISTGGPETIVPTLQKIGFQKK